MVKRNNHNNPQAAEFTDYTVASTPQGIVNATLLRNAYWSRRDYIRTTRSLRRMCRATAVEPRVTAQAAKRCGYPKKRERDEDTPSHRSVPYSNFLRRYKVIDRITSGIGGFIYSTKVYVLHATRGWKLYA